MKKTVIFLIVIALLSVAGIVSSFAAVTSQPLAVSAVVTPSTPEMTLTILEITDGDPDNNPWTNSSKVTTNALSFGTLVHTYIDPTDGLPKEAGVWYSKKYFCVVIFTQGFGRKYEIRSTCANLTTIPNTNNYFALIPVYSDQDKFDPTTSVTQGAMPAGAVLGTPGSAIATGKVIYTSESPSTGRIIQAYYSIPTKKADGSDPYPNWTGIPLSTTPGNVSGTVTLSIVAI